jgi:hypothetical protein
MKGKRLAADRRRTEPIELPLRGVVKRSRKLLPLFRALPASRRSLPAWQHLQVGKKGHRLAAVEPYTELSPMRFKDFWRQ